MFFHVITRPEWTIREGQKYAGTTADNVPVLQIVIHEKESLRGSKFASDSLAAAKEFAISQMQESRRVLSDCVLSIRQTRLHNLVDGTIPGMTKQGFMTKTEDAIRATKEYRENLAKERAAEENGKSTAKTTTKTTSRKKTTAKKSA